MRTAKDFQDVPQVYIIQPLDVSPGSDATIHCVLTGNPAFNHLKWEKNGAPLNTKDSDKYGGGNLDEPSLTIREVSDDDAGTYRCLATNSMGSGKSEPVTLKVYDTVHTFEGPELQTTEAIRKAKKMVENGMVILVGEFGSGKTKALEKVHDHVFEKGNWKTMGAEYDVDDDMKENKRHIYQDRLLICLDNCCRKFNVDPAALLRIQEALPKMRRLASKDSDWRKVIATITNADFSFIEKSLTEEERFSLSKCVIKLADFTEGEKIAMLEEYTVKSKKTKDSSELTEYSKSVKKMKEKGSLENEEQKNCKCHKCSKISWADVKKTIEEEEFFSSLTVLGWPLICRLVAIPDIAQDVNRFFYEPMVTLIRGLEGMRETDIAAYCGLIYMMLKGGTFDESSLDHACLRHILIIHSALPEHDFDLLFSSKLVSQQLKTIPEYVMHNNDKFTFFHEIVTLALFCSFYKKYPNDTIRYCDLNIIADLFRPDDYDNSDLGTLKPLLEKFLIELEDSNESLGEKEKNEIAKKADERGNESAPPGVQIQNTEKNRTKEKSVTTSAKPVGKDQKVHASAKGNLSDGKQQTFVADNRGTKETKQIKEPPDFTHKENSNQSVPLSTKRPVTDKTSFDQNMPSLAKENPVEEGYISGEEHHSKELVEEGEEAMKYLQKEIPSESASPVTQLLDAGGNRPEETALYKFAEERKLEHNRYSSATKIQEDLKQDDSKSGIRGTDIAKASLKPKENTLKEKLIEDVHSAENDSFKAASSNTTATNEQRSRKGSKTKYYFTLNEENHKVLMKRVVDEEKMNLFKGHPLMKKVSYDQLN